MAHRRRDAFVEGCPERGASEASVLDWNAVCIRDPHRIMMEG